MARTPGRKTLTPARARELRAAYLLRDAAKAAFEAAKRSPIRGAARLPYEELCATERRIDELCQVTR